MTWLLNLAAIGTPLGVLAAALVTLLARRTPRAAALGGNVAFIAILVTPRFWFRGTDVVIAPADALLGPLSAVIYVTVGVALLARELRGHYLNAVRRRDWTPAGDGVYVSASERPATHGVLAPVIVVPSLKIPGSVLAHERAHVVWRDPMLLAVRRVLRAVFWFHPGLWVLDRAVSHATELAADRAAVRGADAEGRMAFANTLVGAARQTAAAVALGGGDVEDRVRTLLGCATRWRVVVAVVALLVSVAALPLTPQFVSGEAVRIVIIRR